MNVSLNQLLRGVTFLTELLGIFYKVNRVTKQDFPEVILRQQLIPGDIRVSVEELTLYVCTAPDIMIGPARF